MVTKTKYFTHQVHETHPNSLTFNNMKAEQIKILTEQLELSIKCGRRMMHDFNHLLNEVPDSEIKKEYRERADLWQSIFYPDDGMKNYRAKLHHVIDDMDSKIQRLEDQIKELGVVSDPGLSF